MAGYINEPEDLLPLRRSLGQDATDFIAMALALGWQVSRRGAGSNASVNLIAPGDPTPKRLHLSGKNKGKGSLDSMVKTLIRYAHPDQVRAVVEANEHDPAMRKRIERNILIRGALEDIAEMDENVQETEPEVEVPAEPAPEPPAPEKPKRFIVSERPALMHYSLTGKGGRSYPSKTAIERRWSDGQVDYACAVPTCDATSENKRSFGGQHWAMHVRNGEATPVDREEIRNSLVDDPTYTEPSHTRVQVSPKDLILGILGEYDLATIDPEFLAEQLAKRLFPEPQEDRGPSTPQEPLTAEQMIDRIRRMIDNGHYSDQERIIQNQAEQLQRAWDDISAVSWARDEAARRAERAENNLRALADLIGEAVTNNDAGSDATPAPDEDDVGEA